MGKHTLWINTANHSRFEAEPNKSGLVNELLAEYYAHNLGVSATRITQSELNEVVQKRVDRVQEDLQPMFGSRKPLWKKSTKV